MAVVFAVLGAAIIALLTGLTVFAYKHPIAYKEYFYWPQGILYFLIAAGIWDFSSIHLYETLLPFIATEVSGISTLALGGTSLLIVVSVVIETTKQLESQLVMRSYEGFLYR